MSVKVFLTSSSTKSTASFMVLFIFKGFSITHSFYFSLHSGHFRKIKFCSQVILAFSLQGKILNSSIITFLDCSFLPPIKIFKAPKHLTLIIPWEFALQSSSYSLVIDGTPSLSITNKKSWLFASDTLMYLFQCGI